MRIEYAQVNGERLCTEDAAASPLWVVALQARGAIDLLLRHDAMDPTQSAIPESILRTLRHYCAFTKKALLTVRRHARCRARERVTP